jgi:hypothetical protein
MITAGVAGRQTLPEGIDPGTAEAQMVDRVLPVLSSRSHRPQSHVAAGTLSTLGPRRQAKQQTGLTRALTEILDETRHPDHTEYTFLEMVRSRVYGILAGSQDQNDHDTLRMDPVFKLVADRPAGSAEPTGVLPGWFGGAFVRFQRKRSVHLN